MRRRKTVPDTPIFPSQMEIRDHLPKRQGVQ